jgi:hypothetical protein
MQAGKALPVDPLWRIQESRRVALLASGSSIQAKVWCIRSRTSIVAISIVNYKQEMVLNNTLRMMIAAAIAASAPLAAQETEAVYPICAQAQTRFAGLTTVGAVVNRLVEEGPEPTGNVWQTPSALQKNKLSSGIYWMVNGGPASAISRFRQASMDACVSKLKVADTTNDVIIVYDPTTPSVGLPVLIYRSMVATPNPARLVLSFPHAKTEDDLVPELLNRAFIDARDVPGLPAVRAAVVSTVDRCHSDTALNPASPYWIDFQNEDCENAMGISEARISDDAHNADSLFQTMHQELRRQYWDDFIVQIHGSGDSFSGLSVSNGSGDQYHVNAAEDRDKAVVRWYDELSHHAFNDAPDFTTCHRYTPFPGHWRDPDYFEKRKCGTSNATRGEDPRLPSDEAPGANNPDLRFFHFLHLELDAELRETFENRQKIVGSMTRILSYY